MQMGDIMSVRYAKKNSMQGAKWHITHIVMDNENHFSAQSVTRYIINCIYFHRQLKLCFNIIEFDILMWNLLLSSTLIPLSGVGTTLFHHVIKIRQLIVRSAACLMLALLETVVGANKCKCS
jgi:hypothetical protein